MSVCKLVSLGRLALVCRLGSLGKLASLGTLVSLCKLASVRGRASDIFFSADSLVIVSVIGL